MGTHPIFESDFDCLTEMSRRFRDELDSLEPEYTGAFVIDYGNGSQIFETKGMRENLEKWRWAKADHEDASFQRYLTELQMGIYSNAPSPTSNSIHEQVKELTQECAKFLAHSDDVLRKIIKDSNGALTMPDIDYVLQNVLDESNEEIDENTPLPDFMKELQAPGLSGLDINPPSPSDVGLSHSQIEAMSRVSHVTVCSSTIGPAPQLADFGIAKDNFDYAPAEGDIIRQGPPRPEDFGITSDELKLTDFCQLTLGSRPPEVSHQNDTEKAVPKSESPTARRPRMSDFGIDESTMPVPRKMTTSPKIKLSDLPHRPKAESTIFSPISSLRPPKPQDFGIDENAIGKNCIIPIPPFSNSPLSKCPQVSPLSKYPSDGLLETPKNAFLNLSRVKSTPMTPLTPTLRLNAVKDIESSPFDSPEQTLNLKRPASYKSPIQVMQTEYGIRPVTEDEFLALPSYLRMQLAVRDVNEALLNFGKMSKGDRAFVFSPDKVNAKDLRVRPLLRRLERILIGVDGEFK